MKQTVDINTMARAFRYAGRDSHFSHDGMEILLSGIEELEDGSGEELELDVVGLCCDFVEMTWEEVADQYGIDMSHLTEADETAEEYIRDWLTYRTWVLGDDASIIVFRQF